MPLVIANTKKLFFAHVPKVGGSSVADYLIRRFGGPMTMGGFPLAPKTGRDIITSPEHMTAATAAVMLPIDLDHSFAVVRDPLERISSQYRFQVGVSRLSSLGFSTWLRVVLLGVQKDSRLYDNHIRPQGDLVPENAVTFKLESKFEDMIKWLDHITGTKMPEIQVNHLLKRDRDKVVMFREDVKMIAIFYGDDYDRFGYDLPNFDAYPPDPYATLRNIAAKGITYPLLKWQKSKWLK